MGHLLFNIIGAAVWLGIYSIIRAVFMPAILDSSATLVGIAVVNTAFKVLSTALLLPMSSLLEKLAVKIVPDAKYEEKTVKLDDRLLATPPLTLGQARAVALEMAEKAVEALKSATGAFTEFSKEKAERIRNDENFCDELEDTIGDFERISDHAVNILESAEELRDKNLTLSEEALKEYDVIAAAVEEVLDSTMTAFRNEDPAAARTVEPLEQVIDALKEQLRTNHIIRMQEGKCTAQAGFIWADILTNMERVSDHCSNIVGCVIDTAEHNLNVHESLREIRHSDRKFDKMFLEYSRKYALRE